MGSCPIQAAVLDLRLRPGSARTPGPFVSDPPNQPHPTVDHIRFVWLIEAEPSPPVPVLDDGWTATGDGIIDWAALAPLFRAAAAHHLVTEHDNPGDWYRFAQRSVNHLRQLGL